MNPYRKYQQTKVETASPESLVLMLFDGALKFSAQARTAIESESIEQAHNALMKCQNIIWELNDSLDLSQGEIAENLSTLYGYINERLLDANFRKDVVPLDEATNVIRSMRAMWAEAMSAMANARKADPVANAAV